MKRTILAVALLLAGTIQPKLYAQDIDPFLSYYNSELIHLGYSLWSGITLSYRNQPASTQFGIPQYLKLELYSYKDSKKLAQSYSRLNVAGNIPSIFRTSCFDSR